MELRRTYPYLLLTPAVVSTFTVLAICLVVLLLLSFAQQTYLDTQFGFFTENYAKIWESRLIGRLMVTSTLVAGAVTLISVALAYPIAYFVAFDRSDNKLLWLVLFTLPCWISYLLRIFAWKVILGYEGVINSALIGAGLADAPIEALLYNRTSVIIALTHAWAPFAILPIYVSLEKIDRSLLRASADLGDRPFSTFLRVTLPLSMPGVISAIILIFIPTFADYITPQLLGGPSGVMVGNFIAMQFGSSNNWPLGAAAALAAMLVATLVVCVVIVATGRVTKAIR